MTHIRGTASTAMALTVWLIAAASPCNAAKVTVDQMAQFKAGVATYADVTGKLGRPTTIEAASDGTKTVTYSTTKTRVKGATFVPIVGLFAGGATAEVSLVRFSFDPAGVLTKAWSSDTHADCGVVMTGMNCGQ